MVQKSIVRMQDLAALGTARKMDYCTMTAFGWFVLNREIAERMATEFFLQGSKQLGALHEFLLECSTEYTVNGYS